MKLNECDTEVVVLSSCRKDNLTLPGSMCILDLMMDKQLFPFHTTLLFLIHISL